MKVDYVQRILNSRVYEVARETPLDEATALSARLGVRFLLKREDLQPVHSYKLRGAYNKMCRLTHAELENGVVCNSSGNHAQGVALSAEKLGVRAVVVMPATTPSIKVSAVKAYGASVILYGESYSDTYEELHRQIDEHGYTYIAPFDDPDVIAGQGTVAKEILEQRPEVDSIFVPIGGGGFAAGVSAYVKGVKPSVKVYGVEPDDSDCMARSIEAGHPVTVEHPGLFADGVCVKRPGDETFRICRECLDGVVRVKMSEICEATEDIFEATRSVCEPAGALGLAALKKTVKHGETAVAIISGANMNFASLYFVSADAAFARLKDEVLADGRVDLAEARYILSLLDESFTPSEPLARLMRLLRTAVGDGAVSEAQSQEIARALDETLNLQMTTAEERRRFMY